MKPDNAPSDRPQLGRRSLLGAAGSTGALAAAATLLAKRPAEPVATAKAEAPAAASGYRLSEHVLRYYETTKV